MESKKNHEQEEKKHEQAFLTHHEKSPDFQPSKKQIVTKGSSIILQRETWMVIGSIALIAFVITTIFAFLYKYSK